MEKGEVNLNNLVGLLIIYINLVHQMAHMLLKQIEKKVATPSAQTSLLESFYEIFRNIHLYLFANVITNDPAIAPAETFNSGNSNNNILIKEEEITMDDNTGPSFENTLDSNGPSVPNIISASSNSNNDIKNHSLDRSENDDSNQVTISNKSLNNPTSARWDTKFRHIYLEPMKPEQSMQCIPTPDVSGDYNLLHANSKFLVASVQV